MQQIYHSNAVTNVNIRLQMQKCSSDSNAALATRFNVSNQTVSKWRHRNFLHDASSRPKNIEYALSELETALVVSIRRSSWLPLDEIFETLLVQNKTISRSSVYRCLVKTGLNKVPEQQRDKAKKFKAYQPGYLHVTFHENSFTRNPELINSELCFNFFQMSLYFSIHFVKVR